MADLWVDGEERSSFRRKSPYYDCIFVVGAVSTAASYRPLEFGAWGILFLLAGLFAMGVGALRSTVIRRALACAPIATVGGAPILASQPAWDDRVIATGRRLNGGQVARDQASPILWRFSFSENVSSIVLRFTDGTTTKIGPEYGRRGCWYVQPADKTFALDASGRLPDMAIEATNAGGITIAQSR